MPQLYVFGTRRRRAVASIDARVDTVRGEISNPGFGNRERNSLLNKTMQSFQ